MTSSAAKTAAGRFLRGLSPRRDDPSRDAPHADQRRRFALFGALRRALRAPKRGDFRARHRLSGKPDRRSARLPCRVRQDGARRLAQRGRQSRLRRLPVLAAGLPGDTLSATSQVIGLKENSNRQSGVVHVRSQGFNQRGETVIEYVRWVMVRKRDSAAAAPETHRSQAPRGGRRRRARRGLSAISTAPRSTTRSAVRPIGSRTTRRANGSIMSTASRSRRPSTRPRPGSIRTPPRSISTSSARGRGASAGGSSMAATSFRSPAR